MTLDSDAQSRDARADRVVYVMQADKDDRTHFIDLVALVRVLWAGKWWIALVAFVFGSLGVAYALLATQWFRAEVSLLPADSNDGKGLAGALGQLGGLASIAGINIGAAGGDKAEPLAVLKSRDFVRAFIVDKQLMPVLYADKWDAASKRWIVDDKHIPDLRDGVKFFAEQIRGVTSDPKTGLITLSIEWTDANTAADWANELARRINEQMRARSLKDAQTNLDYLKRELTTTDQVSLQQAISRLMESELQRIVLARGNDEMAFRIVDSAHPPKKRIRPRRPLVALGGGLFGVLLGCLWVVWRGYRAGKFDDARSKVPAGDLAPR